ncbi:putative tRNA (cytidine(34)-2'-O)-methyltransferase [Candidatus Clavichlamydia salmonicola]|uniref:tRNA (cytidine(34)-2'-O)-methyltransferase n=1 Tax=Candidatus Clavichlamydia salmonicola TaxID=469812 RepID=UPI001891314D|nr:tRNA (cytidine(34)-2'-O)-methyltransferase [Candidatus Clavichlamydia salmonicola]MBF5050741.1 putative tRNA (cytidine(34)-2'-O)-methyltransferase [Candidatus Clavichlamydia salmonicola]
MNIILVEPEIPQNVGSIARTCAALGATLTLVRPLGFVFSDRRLKRVAMDYWDLVKVRVVDSFDEAIEGVLVEEMFILSSKAESSCYNGVFSENSTLIFGSESKGLASVITDNYKERLFTIPMPGKVRSLNLAVAVAVSAYEAHRQSSHR